MSDLNIELCPETGICSIVKGNGDKVDLMPDEVGQLRDASGKLEAIREVLAKVDSRFAEGLDSGEISQVADRIKR